MDWVVQKATELGVTRIVPLLTLRSVVRLDASQARKKTEHWQAVAVAACEQCGRNRLPVVQDPQELRPFLAELPPDSTGLLLSPAGDVHLPDLPVKTAAITVLIGPEGGLAPEEQQAAITAGFTPARLGPRVLRTETAAIAALAVIQARLGDL
jgi:16S rRNA (uracil1498-N3)-methyltransferase